MIKSEKYKSSPKTESKLVCRDHLVSGEKFEIKEYEKGILKTHPVPEDLSRYYESEEYISHSDSKSNLQDKIYHRVKSYMLRKKSKWMQSYIKKGRILDYGAGTGEFLNHMKNMQWEVEGVEPNPNARNLGIKKGLDIHTTLTDLKKKRFDIISLWHVLEHVPDLDIKIAEFRKLLNPDGLLIIAVPNYNSSDAIFYKENWAAWDVPRHIWHFSRKGMKQKLVQHGFSLVEEKPLKFDSFYVSLLSEKNKKGDARPAKAFYQGLKSNMSAKSTGEYSSIAYFFKKEVKT